MRCTLAQPGMWKRLLSDYPLMAASGHALLDDNHVWWRQISLSHFRLGWVFMPAEDMWQRSESQIFAKSVQEEFGWDQERNRRGNCSAAVLRPMEELIIVRVKAKLMHIPVKRDLAKAFHYELRRVAASIPKYPCQGYLELE